MYYVIHTMGCSTSCVDRTWIYLTGGGGCDLECLPLGCLLGPVILVGGSCGGDRVLGGSNLQQVQKWG
jgi:hypothetical protein